MFLCLTLILIYSSAILWKIPTTLIFLTKRSLMNYNDWFFYLNTTPPLWSSILSTLVKMRIFWKQKKTPLRLIFLFLIYAECLETNMRQILHIPSLYFNTLKLNTKRLLSFYCSYQFLHDLIKHCCIFFIHSELRLTVKLIVKWESSPFSWLSIWS